MGWGKETVDLKKPQLIYNAQQKHVKSKCVGYVCMLNLPQIKIFTMVKNIIYKIDTIQFT